MDTLFTFLGWQFLPPSATSLILTFYYSVVYKVDAVKPQPGTARYKRHYTRVFTAVVVTYLLYTIYEANRSLPANYFQMLGVNYKDASSRQLKTNFNQISRQYHPDKNPSAEAQRIFIQYRLAYETLSDPIRRFVYERFGPAIHDWDYLRLVTVHDYVRHGLKRVWSFYVGTGFLMLVLAVLGKAQFGRYWRFLIFFALLFLELSMVLSVSDNWLSILLGGYRITFQQITLLHQIFLTIFIGLNQVGPILFPDTTQDLGQGLQSIETLCRVANEESTVAMKEAFIPFAGDEGAKKSLKREMEKIAMESKMMNDPQFMQMYSNVHQRVVTRKK